MTSDEWFKRMTACDSPLGRRLILALMAADQTVKMEPAVRKLALRTALDCTDVELEAAIRELEMAGVVEVKWFH